VDGFQIYSGGSVVSKASTIGIEISLTPPLIFTGGSKSAKFGVVFKITQIWAARGWKCSKISELSNKSAMLRWWPYVVAKFGEVGSTHPWESSVSCAPPPKIARQKRAKSPITQPWSIRFRLNFVHNLITWRLMYHELSRSTGQRSRSHRNITYQHQKTR